MQRGWVIAKEGRRLRLRLDPEALPDAACGSVARIGRGEGPACASGTCSSCALAGSGREIDLEVRDSGAFQVGQRLALEISVPGILLEGLLKLGLPLGLGGATFGLLSAIPPSLAFLVSLSIFTLSSFIILLVLKRFGREWGMRIRPISSDRGSKDSEGEPIGTDGDERG
jgi:hypothetical protein